MIRSAFESYAMPGDRRPVGATAGAMFVHRFWAASYAHVSLSYVLLIVWPPNRIVRADCASYAMPCLDRADGCWSGSRFVQVFAKKSYPHVSFAYVPSYRVPTHPPNRIVCRDPLSYAARKRCVASGCPAGCRFVHVFDSKSYSHVSKGELSSPMPPYSTKRSTRESYAKPPW